MSDDFLLLDGVIASYGGTVVLKEFGSALRKSANLVRLGSSGVGKATLDEADTALSWREEHAWP